MTRVCMMHNGATMETTSTLPYAAPTVQEVLDLAIMTGAKLLEGEAGLQRPVEWCHVVDNPQVTLWVKPNELLLTTG